MPIFKYLNNKNNKNFGFLITSVFLIIFFYFYFLKDLNNLYLIFLSFIFLILTLLRPNFFQIFNFIWLGIGIGMAVLFSNIFLIFFYYTILTPLALISRLFTKNSLNLIFKNNKDSFWVQRTTKIKKMRYQS